MDITQQQEQFSFAYIRAVSTVAGYAVSEPSVDDDSIDLMLSGRSNAGTITRPRLELQAKCLRDGELQADTFSYPVKIKNYDDLRDPNVLVPRILVVVRVPDLVNEWLTSTDAELCLRHCGYWTNLQGMPETDNTSTVSVTVTKENSFTVESLREMMGRIEQGQQP